MRLRSVRSRLSDMVARNQFNTARAVDAFSAAIHWAVWDYVREPVRWAHDLPQFQAIVPRAEHGRRVSRRVQTGGRRV